MDEGGYFTYIMARRSWTFYVGVTGWSGLSVTNIFRRP